MYPRINNGISTAAATTNTYESIITHQVARTNNAMLLGNAVAVDVPLSTVS